jgi:TetR/AcrR family transcriptional regulator, repressor for neighboring sulfatase
VPKQNKVTGRRLRRTPEEARGAALSAARHLLLTAGPDAITLQAVAADLGMSHTNLIHHFGSAAGLQSALMHEMVSELTATIETGIEQLRAGHGSLSDFVDIVFDAFDRGGAGRLAAWIALSGDHARLDPMGQVVGNYIRNIERGADPARGDVHERLTSATLLVAVAAFGDTLIGDALRQMVDREREAVRRMIGRLLPLIVGHQETEKDISTGTRGTRG